MALRDIFRLTGRRRVLDRRRRIRELEQLEARRVLSGGTTYLPLLDVSHPLFQDLSTLTFEPNVGQAAENVDYIARGLDYALSLTGGGSVLSLRAVIGSDAESLDTSLGSADHDLGSQVETSAILQARWVKGNFDAEATGLQPLPGVTNYLFGDGHTYTDISNYGKVRYDDVYPGIDLVYYGHEGELEYDWVVSPGADPTQIVMSFDGMREMSLDDHGRLVLETSAGTLLQQAPVIYQYIGGYRQTVDGRYRLLGSGEVAFELGNYDTARELVIDPVLVYSTYLGGSPAAAPGHITGVDAGNDAGSAIASDAEGNTYVTGFTSAIDFPTVDAYRSQHPHLSASTRPGTVAFVTKLDPAGVPVYSTYVGQSFPNVNRTLDLYANDIAVDVDGEVYIVGNFVDLTTEAVEDDFIGIHTQLVDSDSGAFAANLSANGRDPRLYGLLWR